jgi:hypothetical protein
MVWSQLAELRTPTIATTDFLYLRFIGDRTIDEKDLSLSTVIIIKKHSIRGYSD